MTCAASKIIIPPAAWPEAEIVGWPEPLHRKGASTAPRLLVRRTSNSVDGPSGEELIYVDGAGTHISLFTGCGGFDIGLEHAGFVTVLQHEWDETCCQTLIANRPTYFRHAALIQGDIRQTPTEMILREAQLRVGEAHVFTGGPPCQGFSTASSNRARAEREGDARNDLVFEYLRIIDEAKPHFFIFENVPGFISFNKHAYLKAFLERAYGGFYELVYGLVNAVEHGVPQTRCRFICMGTRMDLFAIEGQLASLPEPHCFSDRDLKRIDLYKHLPLWTPELELLTHPPGVRYFPDRPVLIPPAPVRGICGDEDGDGGGRTQGFIDFYRKLRRDEPDRIVSSPRDPQLKPDDYVTVGEAIGDLPPLIAAVSKRKAVSA